LVNRRIDGIWHCCFKKKCRATNFLSLQYGRSNCWGLSGATSAEVEAQLTKLLRTTIFGYQEVRKEKPPHCQGGYDDIFVELNDNVKNADQFWSKLKHGLTS